MSKTSKIILVTIIATCILLGLGYAAITNITLNIAGSASASADQANFKVRFVGTPVVSDSVAASAKITADHTATISVQGLTTAGQFVTATYEIKNESQDLSGDLKVVTTNSNKEYFTISSKLDKSSLKSGESTTALVTVKLTKTPIDGDVSSNIGVTLTAMPVEPGKEGTSVGTNDFSSSPINKELNEYGFYYGEAYTTEFESGWFVGDSSSVVVHEDGDLEQYWNDNLATYFPASEVEYSENLIKFGNVELNVINNGYVLESNSDTYELDESFMNRQKEYVGELNEYGFYYEVPYVLEVWGSTIAFVLHEDSTISWYDNKTYFEEAVATYSMNNVYTDMYNDMKTYENGTRLMMDNGNNFTFKVNEDFDLFDYVYITTNASTGEKEYLDVFPDKSKVGDMYAVGDYLYTCTSTGWKTEIITDGANLPAGYEFNGKNAESYQSILSDINNVDVTEIKNMYAGCTNLKKAPMIGLNATDFSGLFDGCTSLITGTDIDSNVTNVTNMYRGCTSLTGEIEINSDNITEYAGCFEGVDMSKITLAGLASNATKNKLGSTGLNYEMLPEDEVEE